MLSFSKGRSTDEISNNYMLSYAIVRRFTIMGGAASKISKEFREKHPELPWKDMTAMRNRLVHNYFEINYHIVADTVRNELPPLRSKLAEVLAKENKMSKIKKKGLRSK
ncbi:MAG: DUF86 domain-containing protein [Chitinophagaceae bacterium]|nr:DUF86 domain-containing protein [Chitinophagaceae bacterium]